MHLALTALLIELLGVRGLSLQITYCDGVSLIAGMEYGMEYGMDGECTNTKSCN